MKTKTPTLLLLVFMSLKLIAQLLIIHPVYNLHRDEYLYLDQGNYLAWGYASVPPFTSWISWLVRLLGNGEFVVKLFPALFGALTIMVIWFLVKALGGSFKAQIVAAIAMFFSGLMRVDMLYQPNSFDVLCWTTIYFILVCFLKTKQSKFLYFLAITAAIGFLNKYNVSFLLAGLIPALLVTKHRLIFLNKHLYLSLGIGILLVLPNILWQISNDFPVMRHMRELAQTQLVNVSRRDFLIAQLTFFLGGVLVWVTGLLSTLFSKLFKEYRWVGLSYLITIIIFIVLNGKGYYAMGLYPALLAFGCVFIEKSLSRGWQRWILPGLSVLNLIAFIPFTKAFPMYPPQVIEQNQESYRPLGLLRWEDGKDHLLPQDFADMLGWKELAEKVKSVYIEMPDSAREHVLIFCDNYGQAGAINYFTGKLLPAAVSFNADYLNWFPRELDFKNIILVKEAHDTLPQSLQGHFMGVELKHTIENPYAREFGTRIYVCYGAHRTVHQMFYDEIRKRLLKG